MTKLACSKKLPPEGVTTNLPLREPYKKININARAFTTKEACQRSCLEDTFHFNFVAAFLSLFISAWPLSMKTGM